MSGAIEVGAGVDVPLKQAPGGECPVHYANVWKGKSSILQWSSPMQKAAETPLAESFSSVISKLLKEEDESDGNEDLIHEGYVLIPSRLRNYLIRLAPSGRVPFSGSTGIFCCGPKEKISRLFLYHQTQCSQLRSKAALETCVRSEKIFWTA